ncbi:dihydropteroate synthase [Flaviflexus huanghaiensis]|uniref:dihydropteroate synthase n=1 Tax=Flaviflexus huanghaiensis TaxID=1111473 RepID=UPI0015F88746
MDILGILNVTPDSFSDGGNWDSAERALARGRQLIADGATIVDVGGESTRPGASSIGAYEEWSRIQPVVEGLVSDDITVSVDTYHAATAERAIAAGAAIINDVTGGRIEPDIHHVVAGSDAHYVLQHSRGGPATTVETAVYHDIIADIADEMTAMIDVATAAGIDPARLILDPGLGFSKVGNQDWDVLKRFDELTDRLPGRWLIGHSRKRFLATAGLDRDHSTAIVSALLYGRAWGVRVHEPAMTAAALDIAGRIHD